MLKIVILFIKSSSNDASFTNILVPFLSKSRHESNSLLPVAMRQDEIFYFRVRTTSLLTTTNAFLFRAFVRMTRGCTDGTDKVRQPPLEGPLLNLS